MAFTYYFLVAGALLIFMALAYSLVDRLPLSTAMVYLAAGYALSPAGAGLLDVDPLAHAALLERITEVAVLVSLFTTGLKLSPPLRDPRWRLPLRLAFGSMLVTVMLIAGAAMVGLGLSPGAAILLGAILAPTDPVLAADVQVADAGDRDRLRFALTGEAGLNDGAAFPFVMLGLALLGLENTVSTLTHWVLYDVVWATVAGLAVGGGLGLLVGRLVVYLRSRHQEAVGLDEFLGLGLIALSYGAALLVDAYGFLAVFAAGLALRRIERRASGEDAPVKVKQVADLESPEEVATHPDTAPAYMTRAVLGFNEQLERIGEMVVVVIAGALLGVVGFAAPVWFLLLLFLVIRPVSVWVGLAGSRTTPAQRHLTAWFGIRGIGSLYYLMFAIQHGMPAPLAARLSTLVLSVVAVSVVVHGVSVTPLMNWYGRIAGARQAPAGGK